MFSCQFYRAILSGFTCPLRQLSMTFQNQISTFMQRFNGQIMSSFECRQYAVRPNMRSLWTHRSTFRLKRARNTLSNAAIANVWQIIDVQHSSTEYTISNHTNLVVLKYSKKLFHQCFWNVKMARRYFGTNPLVSMRMRKFYHWPEITNWWWRWHFWKYKTKILNVNIWMSEANLHLSKHKQLANLSQESFILCYFSGTFSICKRTASQLYWTAKKCRHKTVTL